MKDKFVCWGVACILLYMLPYYILGEDAYVTIHDFIEQNVTIMANLKNNGLLLSVSGTVPNMDGLDRSLFPYFTPFDVKMVCYALLPTYWAIITYTLIYKLVAFWGMFLLLDTYIFGEKDKWVSLLLSLGFAFVPFYMELALSGAGFPLVACAFLNLYNNKNKCWSYVVISFYAFNSLLAYGGFFLILIIFCWMIYDYNRTKKFSKNVIIGTFLLCFIYILANWGTLYSLFFSESFVSHRTEWIHNTSFVDDIKGFIGVLMESQYHAGTIVAIPVLFAFIVVFLKFQNKYTVLKFTAFLYVLIVIGIFTGMMLKFSGIQLFISIQFDRFYFFYPSSIILLLSAVTYVMIRENHTKCALFLALYGLGCGIVNDSELKSNLKILTNRQIEHPTFKQFYDTSLFEKIRSSIGVNGDYQTKVVSVGLYPSVAEYNGFYTLDSYRVNYPIEFKYKFRKVISKELDKDDAIKSNFDNWGSRCYVFSAELGKHYLYGKSSKKRVSHLDIDTKALKQLGCQYIISAVDIDNYKELNLKYKGSFTTEKSFWDIKVYKL